MCLIQRNVFLVFGLKSLNVWEFREQVVEELHRCGLAVVKLCSPKQVCESDYKIQVELNMSKKSMRWRQNIIMAQQELWRRLLLTLAREFLVLFTVFLILWCTVSCMATKSSRPNLSRGICSLRMPASTDAEHRAGIWSRTVNRLWRCQATTVWARPWHHATDAISRSSAEGTDWRTGTLVSTCLTVLTHSATGLKLCKGGSKKHEYNE